MSTQICPERRQLEQFVLGELSDKAIQSIVAHAEECPTCSETLADLDQMSDTVISQLRATRQPSQFATDAEYARALAAVKAFGHDPNRTADRNAHPQDLPNDDQQGQTLRVYRLIRKIGEGGMGSVYEAIHTKLNKTVALKVLPPERMQDAGAVARFEREMLAVGQLDHPNIVRATDAGEFEGTHFLVMELVNGIDLSRLVKAVGPLPIADACELIRQAAIGLQYAHENGLVHRDIKPSNLMLAFSQSEIDNRQSAILKILDLGLARLDDRAAIAQDGLTSTGQIMGTTDYMAPEQFTNSHDVDIRADIYSLGCTLFKLLTGTAPFSGPDYTTVFQKMKGHIEGTVPMVASFRPEVPRQLAEIVNRMLAKEADDRYATPRELAEALRPFSADCDLAALLDSTSEREATRLESPESKTESPLLSPMSDTLPADPSVGLTRVDEAGADVSTATYATPKPSAAKTQRRPRWIIGTIAVALMIVLGTVIYIRTDHGELVITVNAEDVKVTIDGKEPSVVNISSPRDGKIQITIPKVRSGERLLKVTKDAFEADVQKFRISRNGRVELTAELSPLVSSQNSRASRSGSKSGNDHSPPLALAPFDKLQAEAHQKSWAEYLHVPVLSPNSLGMQFTLIPPGKRTDESDLEVRKPFYMAQHEVTVGVFEEFVKATGYQTEIEKNRNGGFFDVQTPNSYWPSKDINWRKPGFDQDAQHPVCLISWNDANAFCKWLSRRESKTYRLPTAAEWEWACRAGTIGPRYFENAQDQMKANAWSRENSHLHTQPVGLLRSIQWYLHDMYGNVIEWIQDPFIESGFEGRRRKIFGGAWKNLAGELNSSHWGRYSQSDGITTLGFRIVRDIEATDVPLRNEVDETVLLRQRIENADGMLTEWFGLCQTMRIEDFVRVSEQLRKYHYRPTRLRPYSTNDRIRVAAVWTRDDKEWDMLTNATREEIKAKDRELGEAGFVPIDVAGYLAESERFTAVWSKSDTEGESTVIRVGQPQKIVESEWPQLTQAGMWPRNANEFYDRNGERIQNLIWRKTKNVIVWGWWGDRSSYENLLAETRECQIDAQVLKNLKNDPPNFQFNSIFWGTEYVNLESHGLNSTEHLIRCRAFAKAGFHPAAISVAVVENGKASVTASVWHHFKPVNPSDIEKWGELPELQHLDLGGSNINDRTIHPLASLSELRSLNLGMTTVTDNGLKHVQALHKLRYLDSRSTQISDVGLQQISKLPELKVLELGDTNVSDKCLEHMAQLTNLTGLGLQGTKVTDSGMQKLKGLTNLVNLGLDRTSISDAGIEHLKELKNLAGVWIPGTKVTDKGVAELKAALPNCKVYRD